MHIVQAREVTGQAYVEGQVTIGTRRVSKRDIANWRILRSSGRTCFTGAH